MKAKNHCAMMKLFEVITGQQNNSVYTHTHARTHARTHTHTHTPHEMHTDMERHIHHTPQLSATFIFSHIPVNEHINASQLSYVCPTRSPLPLSHSLSHTPSPSPGRRARALLTSSSPRRRISLSSPPSSVTTTAA